MELSAIQRDRVDSFFQVRVEKELAEERERNKDDIAHLESLEKHYAERVQAYEVCWATC